MTYQYKTKQEEKLQRRVDNAHLTDGDFFNLFWQLWGACSLSPNKWKTFEHIVSSYIKPKGF